jgi:hypothetical protein
MNERIQEFAEQAKIYALDLMRKTPDLPDREQALKVYSESYDTKFAELIVEECSNLLFDESERLYAYSAECDNMREIAEAELVAEKCVDLIKMIEDHFGIEYFGIE